jgi:predicted dehydrogenase
MAPVGIAIVSLGQRSFSRAIDAINEFSDIWTLVAATDPDSKARFAFQSRFPDVPVFETTELMLQWNAQQSMPAIRAVYVAVPHHIYGHVIPPLLRAHLHVLKEKPAATSVEEVMSFQQSAMANYALLRTASQRRYGKDLAQIEGVVATC